MKRRTVRFAVVLSFGLGLAWVLFWWLGDGLRVVRAQGPDIYSVYYVDAGGGCGGTSGGRGAGERERVGARFSRGIGGGDDLVPPVLVELKVKARIQRGEPEVLPDKVADRRKELASG